MQLFKNKYVKFIIIVLIISPMIFASPMGELYAYSVNNEYVDIYKVLEKVKQDSVDNSSLSKRKLRKLARAEKRRLKKELKAKKRAEKEVRREARREAKSKTKPSETTEPVESRQDTIETKIVVDSIDSVIKESVDTVKIASNRVGEFATDSTTRQLAVKGDSLLLENDSLPNLEQDSVKIDSVAKVRKPKQFLDEIIHSTNVDSMVFNVKENDIFLYNKAEVAYGSNTLKADFMKIQLTTNVINARGVPDSVGVMTKPNFNDGSTTYDMDSIAYNLKTQKANVKNAFFKEGEGFIHGEKIKKSTDKMINIKGGKYTTCDCETPHFYLASTKAQLIQGKGKRNIVFGPSYLVIEDVPLPLILPFGFFPLMSNRNSGFIIPEFGEESQKGFFLRGGGYYFAFNDYFDATVRGGIYTLGSWEASLMSTYKKRYKYNGNVGITYSKDIIGEKGSSDYQNINNYRITWSHTQDPKFLPNSTFSASVNFSSSTFNKLNGSIEDYITAQTNSSISYSKNWTGKPMSLSMNLQHSQNNRDSTVTLSLPNVVFNVSKIFPFKRKKSMGKQAWYEKISLGYTGTFNNSVTTKQNMLFKKEMFDNMKYGINHQIPVSTSFSVLKYLNISPSINYQERWYFNKIEKQWDPNTQSVVVSDTIPGFNRVYNYNLSFGLQTTIYGMYTVKGDRAIKAVRHMMTPSVSFTYAPDFGDFKYGFYKPIQTDKNGTIGKYSPYENGIYGVPGSGQSGSISFSLGNTLEMKVRNKQDTSGEKKIKIFESLNLSASYNLLADSMNLSPISISARTTLFKSLGINASASLDPYKYTDRGVKTKQLALGRITNASLSFGYSFRSVFGHEGEGSGTGSETLPRDLTPEEMRTANDNGVNPNAAVSLLTPEYYNFSIPWNLSLNYNLSYNHSGNKKSVTQTVSYNGSITITKNWGLTFSGGVNLENFQITPGSISIDRDLHCWQMGFTWVPVGYRKSWSFNIKVKSAVLQDLKFKKSSGFLDNYY